MAPIPEIFEKNILVKEKHLDEQNHVNNVQYVQWVQDVAKAHWEARASQEQNLQFFWIVVKHEISYKQQAFLGDKILLQTYVGETSNVKSVRHVIIKNAESEKVLVEAKTTWALMDQEKKKPARISEDLKRVFQQ
ncbi:acyl-CoA thioester hydrolase [Salegentibacter holothuriorum]|uniref:Acyl-CoA thioester hydrolase n=1 Tax=Salegentibacter holothuriorum TaxID=241145 RepID=A0A1T5D861_9FLAO|nr:acyl-CoA thioesterase [Salegentibacter holothuriorum]SKB67816.1 acyl-CoA thioester hydrolase [Salegentibacter holothuriorum]